MQIIDLTGEEEEAGGGKQLQGGAEDQGGDQGQHGGQEQCGADEGAGDIGGEVCSDKHERNREFYKVNCGRELNL